MLRPVPDVCQVLTGVLLLLWLDAVAVDTRGPGPAVPEVGVLVVATGLRCAADRPAGETGSPGGRS
ncbi:hypothetical protein TUSST3_57700 [Streptomyces sp. TUS-ST3]|uniref:hypothetical protein n=1 Tax=Streptomyces sp. TUS-ST3 TaxID=3025591 RepID=UPI00235B33E3|nr:hypothetical protein [Streptomyces sp. TUS-ST3]GLP69147.1 hypothetical protein TUSST3_57700 [Streptomyces sp. TUS-ST3]